MSVCGYLAHTCQEISSARLLNWRYCPCRNACSDVSVVHTQKPLPVRDVVYIQCVPYREEGRLSITGHAHSPIRIAVYVAALNFDAHLVLDHVNGAHLGELRLQPPSPVRSAVYRPKNASEISGVNSHAQGVRSVHLHEARRAGGNFVAHVIKSWQKILGRPLNTLSCIGRRLWVHVCAAPIPVRSALYSPWMDCPWNLGEVEEEVDGIQGGRAYPVRQAGCTRGTAAPTCLESPSSPGAESGRTCARVSL
jgi:hypothetical protein